MPVSERPPRQLPQPSIWVLELLHVEQGFNSKRACDTAEVALLKRLEGFGLCRSHDAQKDLWFLTEKGQVCLNNGGKFE